MNVPLWVWSAVLGVILVILAVDLFAALRAPSGTDGDQSSDKYSLRALRLMFAAGLLVGAPGALFAAHRFGNESPASAASSSTAATRSTAGPPSAPIAAPTETSAAIASPCRGNVAQFVHMVRTEIDPDGDELQGVDDVSLVRLGKLALKQPSVLEATSLVPFQRPRFIGAANQWLCH